MEDTTSRNGEEWDCRKFVYRHGYLFSAIYFIFQSIVCAYRAGDNQTIPWLSVSLSIPIFSIGIGLLRRKKIFGILGIVLLALLIVALVGEIGWITVLLSSHRETPHAEALQPLVMKYFIVADSPKAIVPVTAWAALVSMVMAVLWLLVSVGSGNISSTNTSRNFEPN